jgi:hypothetical protein
VYVSAGVLAALVHLSAQPVAAGVSASAAIFGVYGLLVACLIWQTLQPLRVAPQAEGDEAVDPEADRPVTIPPIAMKRLGIVAAVFFVASALEGLVSVAAFAGLGIGLGYGLVLGRRIADRAPSVRLVGAVAVATAAIAVACAMPLRNIADVRPELVKVVATEERTATTYTAAVDRFKRGRLTADGLAQLAERTIVPELQAADARLQALDHVPLEHQPLVADAREFLHLRCASWRARAEAVRKTNAEVHPTPGAADAPRRLQAEARFRSNLVAAGHAEAAERASLEVFERVKRAVPAKLD